VSERTVRGALIALGAAALLRGGYLVAFGLPPRTWLAMLLWLAVGSLVHDLLIAPTSLLLGRTLTGLRAGGPGRTPTGSRVVENAVRGAWLGTGTVLLVGLPLLVGADRRANPTVIPGNPLLNLVLSLALVIVGAGLVIAVDTARRRRS
jgi:hypothetical protein